MSAIKFKFRGSNEKNATYFSVSKTQINIGVIRSALDRKLQTCDIAFWVYWFIPRGNSLRMYAHYISTHACN